MKVEIREIEIVAEIASGPACKGDVNLGPQLATLRREMQQICEKAVEDALRRFKER